MTRPELKLVDPDTGELVEHRCDECEAKDGQIRGLERDLRAWRMRYAELARDQEADARNDDLWDEAEVLFDYWRRRCRHPKSKFTVERFELLRPYLKRYGAELCRRAIDGASFDPYTTTRKNGTTKRHDGLGLVFRSAEHFEDFANRAPVEAT